MNHWLFQHFIANHTEVSDPTVRTAYGSFTSVVSIIANVILCFAKAIVGIFAGSISILADAFNNLSDAASNIIALLGFKLASKPPDDEHPWGHGRYEYLAGLAVAALIVLLGFELARSSIGKIIQTEAVECSTAVIVVLTLSILVKLWMSSFNRAAAQRISSDTLQGLAIDSRNDCVATAAVLVSLVIGQVTGINLDGWAGLAVGIFIVYSGARLMHDTVRPLLGSAPDPQTVKDIHDRIMAYPGVLGTHDLMVHDYGPGRRFASAHVEMAAEIDPLESHDCIDNIEQDFCATGLPLVLHYDPIVTNDPAVETMRDWLGRNVKRIDERLSIHDLRLVHGTTHTNVVFDVLRPQEFSLSDKELKAQLSDIVREHCPDAICKITVDRSYLASPYENK